MRKKIGVERFKKLQKDGKEIIAEKADGIVFILRAVKDKKGVATTGMCCVHGIRKDLLVKIIYNSFKLSPIDFLTI